jgi:hypothetical protein
VEDIDNKLIRVLASENFFARGDDRVPAALVQAPSFGVGEGRRALDANERTDEGGERAIAADRVVLDRSLGLRSPQRVRWELDLA